ncbi:M16 family metallopeptidase [Steroidobacter flavus]|uniref:M16 family metallopeptidase n=1 Tax=Steroidobacter flavus TaxID=1842136 RepID=A0ABV8T360_9GAMM
MTAPNSLSPELNPESNEAAAPLAGGFIADDVTIPYEKFHLDNGLTVIVHENRRAPTVTVAVWYRVGAKEEPAGKTGFAHLFEHLMFGGSRHFPGLYLSNMLNAGATNLNGTTNRDRTNYYQTVPTEALDYALFAESDRMGHFYETISQQTLDIQRGVVQNEKRQTEGGPFGLVYDSISRGTYPVGHPYAHTTIGSMEDIQSATLDDVKNWFKTYYGPSNAVLVLAGDIDAATAKRKANEYFGAIPPGPPLRRSRAWIAKMTGVKRETLEDRVSQARVYMVWNTPQTGERDVTLLGLAAQILSSGTSSRLHRRLVHDDALASGIDAGMSAGTIAGQFSITATVKGGVALETVEQTVREELQRFLIEGPTADELERVRTQELSSFIRGLDSVSSIAAMLASNEVRLERPDLYRLGLQWVREATCESIRDAAQRWLSDGSYVLQVVPFPTLRATGKEIDRSKVPSIGTRARVTLPELQHETLSNGMRIVLAERHELPLINFGVMFKDGLVDDPADALGSMRLTARLLTLGSGSRDAFEFSEARRRIGAKLSVNTVLEGSGIGMSTFKGQVDQALELLGDLIFRPHFAETHLARERERILEIIAQEATAPDSSASRVLPGLLFDKGHPYRRPMSGFGVTSQVSRLDRDSVQRCYSRWFRPEGTVLLVVGDTTMSEIKPKLERCLGQWRAANWHASPPVPAAAAPLAPSVYLIDKPDTPQAIIRAATVLPFMEDEVSLPVKIANMVLGGEFGSRLNINLREDKNWTYGVRSSMTATLGPRVFQVSAPVQIDKTAQSIAEIQRELSDMVGARPVTQDELARVTRTEMLRFGTGIGSLGGLQSAIEYLIRRERTPEHWSAYPERLAALTVERVNSTFASVFAPERMVWIVTGDLQKIEPQLRDLDLGSRHIVSSDGEALYG